MSSAIYSEATNIIHTGTCSGSVLYFGLLMNARCSAADITNKTTAFDIVSDSLLSVQLSLEKLSYICTKAYATKLKVVQYW